MANNKNWQIYFDTCCLNRPFDDQTQDRIRLETEAILLIMKHLQEKKWDWVGSDVLNFEIEQIPNIERKRRVQAIAKHIHHIVSLGNDEVIRGEQFELMGFSSYDALHLACAESGQANIFITVDSKLIQLAKRKTQQLKIRVENPLIWLEELTA